GYAMTIEEMLEIKVIKIGGNKEIFSSKAWRQDDRYDKIQRNELWLMCMFEDRNKERYAHVDWVIAKLMKRKGMVIQEGSIIICGQIVTKLVKKLQLLSNDVLDGLRDPNYCRSLDATTPRELIGPDGRLIVKDPSPGVPRFAIPRPQ
ncbi:hypothetical protein Tco_0114396, partial [Tanacetum coccineum]